LCPVVVGFQMSSLQRRLTILADTLAAIADTAINLKAQLFELDKLREQVGKRGHPPINREVSMPIEKQCSRCSRSDTVHAVSDPDFDRDIFVCMECAWWGTEPNNMAYPFSDWTRVTIVRPEPTNVTPFRRITN
jgi:hypothetical protein